MHASRRILALLMLLLLPLLVCGCGPSSGEKQIFPICMSMDALPDGRLQLAVQVNNLTGEDDAIVFTAAGDTFPQALQILGASMPYPLHFGQLRLCLISHQLATEQSLRTLLEPVAGLSTIRRSATVMVVLGNACETMAAQKPDLGVRLSTYLDQLLARLRQEGLTPPESLQDVLHMLQSGYGDPLLGLCALHAAAGNGQENGGEATQPQPAAPAYAPTQTDTPATGEPTPAGEQSPSRLGAQPVFQGSGSIATGEPTPAGEQSPSRLGAQPVFQGSGSIAIGEPTPGGELPQALLAGTLPRQGGNPVEYIGSMAVAADRAAGVLTAAETRLCLALRRGARVTQLSAEGAVLTVPVTVSPAAAVQLVTKLQTMGSDAIWLGTQAIRLGAAPTETGSCIFFSGEASKPLTITW